MLESFGHIAAHEDIIIQPVGLRRPPCATLARGLLDEAFHFQPRLVCALVKKKLGWAHSGAVDETHGLLHESQRAAQLGDVVGNSDGAGLRSLVQRPVVVV